MDYKLKEIILNYFTSVKEDDIQDIIAQYNEEPNGDEKIREKLAADLDDLLDFAYQCLPDHVDEEHRKFLTDILKHIYDNIDAKELVTYIDWE